MSSPTFGRRNVGQPASSAASAPAPDHPGPAPARIQWSPKWPALVAVGVIALAAIAVSRVVPLLSSHPAGPQNLATAAPAAEPAGDALAAVDAVAAAHLPAWATLYPGATDVSIQPNGSILPNARDWDVRYTVPEASPQQVAAFYQEAADRAGFVRKDLPGITLTSDDPSALFVMHVFLQPATLSSFSYTARRTPSGTRVVLEPSAVN
jgi:hypothetical protein